MPPHILCTRCYQLSAARKCIDIRSCHTDGTRVIPRRLWQIFVHIRYQSPSFQCSCALIKSLRFFFSSGTKLYVIVGASCMTIKSGRIRTAVAYIPIPAMPIESTPFLMPMYMGWTSYTRLNRFPACTFNMA